MGKEIQTFDTRYIRRQEHIRKKDRLLSSIYKISQLLNRSITSDKVLQALVKEMKRAFDLQRSLIFLINKKENKLEVKYVIGFSPVEVNRAFNYPLDMNKNVCRETLVAKTGKTIYIRNSKNSPIITEFDFKMDSIWNRTSSISMPLKIKGEIIGVIQGDQTEKELVLSKSDIKLFSTFASHASTIIENARLQEQNKKKIAQLLSLQEITKKTSSTLDLRKLLNIVTVNALKITGASVCTLLLAERDYLRIVSQVGQGVIDTEKVRLKIGQGIVGWVAEKGVPLLVGDIHEEPRYIDFVPGTGSKLAVPLVSEKKVLGVLVVDSYEKAAFSLDDLDLLMVFASHISVVIESARLYEQVMTEKNFTSNILESSPNGIITIDENKRVRSLNRKTEEILGIKRKNILDKKISEIFKEGEILEVLNNTIDNHVNIENQELTFSRQDGSSAILGISSSAMKMDEKDVSAMIITIRDLTEIKQTERLIRRMDRLSSLGQLSAAIAHEIRNPLASINFNAQLLAKKFKTDKATDDIMADTFEGIERIKILVKRVLDFTKTGSPAFRKGNIHNIINESIALIEPQIKKRKVEIKKYFSDGIPDIIFDPNQIQQVLVNLMLNAGESMEKDGVIEIRSCLEKRRSEQTRLTISITDSGIGIKKDDLTRIFDPFYTNKADGTGLGLSIVQKIMEQHDALIEVKSKENKGTTFILRFPVKVGE
ncbi:MAG: GAF domain-containing protein [Syntrophales bacterium]|nr:GAF domain-containing protein [Syntrophales bacterium]